MTTLRHKYIQNWSAITYEWFLHLFPQQKFYKIVDSLKIDSRVPYREMIQHELYIRGWITEGGEEVMGRKVKNAIVKEISRLSVPVRKRKVKRADVLSRNREGRERLEEWLRSDGYYNRGMSTMGSVWTKELFLVTIGTGWVYVYLKQEKGWNWGAYMKQIGYFQLGGDVIEMMGKAEKGKLLDRSFRHGQRRKYFIMRKKRKNIYMNRKRRGFEVRHAIPTKVNLSYATWEKRNPGI